MAKRWQRTANGATNGFMFVAAGIAYVVVLVWGVVLLAQHTVQSVVLGLVLTVVGLCMVLLRIYVVRQRLAAGLNPITGLRRS